MQKIFRRLSAALLCLALLAAPALAAEATIRSDYVVIEGENFVADTFCGVDALYEGCMAIKEGYIDASSAQSSDDYANALIDRIENLQSGEVDSHCVDDQIFNALLVTQDNVDEMLARYAELGYDGQ